MGNLQLSVGKMQLSAPTPTSSTDDAVACHVKWRSRPAYITRHFYVAWSLTFMLAQTTAVSEPQQDYLHKTVEDALPIVVFSL